MKKVESLTRDKSCKTCVHCDLPAKSEICLDCWNYQRWKKWKPKEISMFDLIGGVG